MPAAPTVNTGVRSTEVGINQDRRVVDMRDKIYDYDPDASPMLTILSKRAPAQRAGNPVFKHLEDQPLPWWDAVNNGAGITATATTVAVDHGSYFRGGDLVLNARTGEILKVSSVASNNLTVIRGYTGDQTNGVAMNDNDALSIIGNTNEEFAASRTIKSTQEATVTNYLEIFRDPFGASETLGGSDLYGEAERPRQRRKNATQHAFSIERSFLFGKPVEVTGSGGHKERSTGGILYWATNVDDAAGALTASTIETFCEGLFRYGAKRKLVLCSRLAASELDLIAENRLRVVPREDTYGVSIKQYVTAHGELMLATHDMLVDGSTAGQGYAGYMVGVDLENVAKRFINDSMGRARDAQLRTNIQQNDEDGWKDEYLSEVGLHVFLSDSHRVLNGIT